MIAGAVIERVYRTASHRDEGRATLLRGLAVFALTAVAYGLFAAPVPFYDKGEPREALVVRAAAAGADLVLPRPDGHSLPAKPPLFHWLAAGALRLGIWPTELAVRSPSIIAGAAGVAGTTVMAGAAFGCTVGFVAGVLLASAFEWFRAATEARVDMLLTALIGVAAVALHVGSGDGRGRGLVRLGYLAAAAAVLTKGPVGLVLPILIVVVDAGLSREWARLRPLCDPFGLGIVVALAGAWYVLAWQRGGAAFVQLHVLTENVHRFVGDTTVAHRHDPLYYVGALAGGLLPWTILIPFGLMGAARSGDRRVRFLLTWIAVVLAFYGLAAGKRSVYLLPLYPPLLVLVAWTLDGIGDSALGRGLRIPLLSIVVLASALGSFVLLGSGAWIVRVATEMTGGSDRGRIPALVQVLETDRWLIEAVLVGIVASTFALTASTTRTQRTVALTVIAAMWTTGLNQLGTLPLARSLTAAGEAARMRTVVARAPAICARGYVEPGFRFYFERPLPTCGSAGGVGEGALAIDSVQDAATGRRLYRLHDASAAARAGATM